MDLITQEIVSLNTQKVFQLPGLPAAYALYGNVEICDSDPDAPTILDLSAEMSRLVRSRQFIPPDLLAYSTDVASELQSLLIDAKARGAVFYGSDAYPDGTAIARILFFGYFNGVPCETNIMFRHRNETLCHQIVSVVDLQKANPEILGSLAIERRLFSQQQSEKTSLFEAAQNIERYIQACDCDEGRASDATCFFIGGHIHIAAITSTCFHWLKPPFIDG